MGLFTSDLRKIDLRGVAGQTGLVNTLEARHLWQALLGEPPGWLLARHQAVHVVPMALGVPVFGMVAAALWLGEPLPAWKLGAAALVMGGLALDLFWPQLRARFARW